MQSRCLYHVLFLPPRKRSAYVGVFVALEIAPALLGSCDEDEDEIVVAFLSSLAGDFCGSCAPGEVLEDAAAGATFCSFDLVLLLFLFCDCSVCSPSSCFAVIFPMTFCSVICCSPGPGLPLPPPLTSPSSFRARGGGRFLVLNFDATPSLVSAFGCSAPFAPARPFEDDDDDDDELLADADALEEEDNKVAVDAAASVRRLGPVVRVTSVQAPVSSCPSVTTAPAFTSNLSMVLPGDRICEEAEAVVLLPVVVLFVPPVALIDVNVDVPA